MCHQTVSLTARYLEENGIPTVLIANARDIVEYCGVARLLFVDYPLGNPCGRPFEVEEQRRIFDMALDLLANATEPRSTVVVPQTWPGGDDWKRLIFSEEQPFLDENAHNNWINAKQHYKKLKKEGKV